MFQRASLSRDGSAGKGASHQALRPKWVSIHIKNHVCQLLQFLWGQRQGDGSGLLADSLTPVSREDSVPREYSRRHHLSLGPVHICTSQICVYATCTQTDGHTHKNTKKPRVNLFLGYIFIKINFDFSNCFVFYSTHVIRLY